MQRVLPVPTPRRRSARFGDGELEGWSAMQCFIDVFSCRVFDPEVAAAVAVAHFGGRRTLRVLQR